MQPLVPQTNLGRKRAGDDIHHKTYDGDATNRPAQAKASRHAARLEAALAAKKEVRDTIDGRCHAND